MSELKPCPMCGGKASMRGEYDADGMRWAYVQCDGCHIRTFGDWFSPGNDDPQFYQDRRDEWNRRTDAQAAEPIGDGARTALIGLVAALDDPFPDEDDYGSYQRFVAARDGWYKRQSAAIDVARNAISPSPAAEGGSS